MAHLPAHLPALWPMPLLPATLLLAVLLAALLFGMARPAGANVTLVALPGNAPAPALRLPVLTAQGEGAPVDVQDYAGSVLVLNFWAVWCAPCRREMPALARAAEQLRPQGVALLTVNQGDAPEKVRAFLAALALDLPTVLDRQLATTLTWGVQGLPVTFVLDRQGRIRFAALGERAWDDPAMIAQIRALAEQ